MGSDFLLDTDAARELYHRHAEKMPIIDYHCHLPPKEIAEDMRWTDVAQVWLGGDHYKWRQMRSNDIRLLHESTRRKALLLKFRVALLPNAFGGCPAKALIYAEIARKLKMRPIKEWILDEALHRLGKLDELGQGIENRQSACLECVFITPAASLINLPICPIKRMPFIPRSFASSIVSPT